MRFLCTLCLLLPIVLAYYSNAPVVKINQGFLRGKYVTTAKGRTFNAFMGIPYAQPPVGSLRFEPPQRAQPWNGVLNASNAAHKVCPQFFLTDSGPKGEDDCLYLNVYTPQLKEKLPVMIFFHGGGFSIGDGTFNSFNPRNLMEKDIVLIVPNYRLGPLGFLSTGDEVVPGNNGLKDQNFVIKWAKENIANFGGNPNRITLFGQSAGGSSVHYHMLSPLSKDLIKGGILQSGTAISAWGLAPNDEGKRNSRKLAEYFNCSTESSQEIVDCLRQQDAYELIRSKAMFYEWNGNPMTPFKPVIEPNIEGAFIPKHPIDIIKSGKVAKVPFMIGITTEDGAMKSTGVFNNSQLWEELNDDFLRIAPYTFGYYDRTSDEELVSRKVRQYYLGHEEITNSSKPAVTDIYTDSLFLTPMNKVVRLHMEYTNQPVYYYAFGYRGSISHSTVFGDYTYNYGVCHADELFYLFAGGLEFPDYKPTHKDKIMSNILTTLWTNFAETGNPTPTHTSGGTTKWKPVKTGNLEYLLIKNDTSTEMAEKLYWERAEFWRHLPLHSKN